jgi:hypothetical protein
MKTWLCCGCTITSRLGFTLVWWRHLDRKRQLMARLARLGALERAENNEDDFSVLDSLDAPSGIRFAISQFLDVI